MSDRFQPQHSFSVSFKLASDWYAQFIDQFMDPPHENGRITSIGILDQTVRAESETANLCLYKVVTNEFFFMAGVFRPEFDCAIGAEAVYTSLCEETIIEFMASLCTRKESTQQRSERQLHTFTVLAHEAEYILPFSTAIADIVFECWIQRHGLFVRM